MLRKEPPANPSPNNDNIKVSFVSRINKINVIFIICPFVRNRTIWNFESNAIIIEY
jgi:hypothetical protein